MKKKFTLAAIAMALCLCNSFSQTSLKIIPNGNVGVSTDNPIEKLQVNGAINIGNTIINAPGSIRWTGSDFEGFDGITWKSLTKCECEESNSSNNQVEDEEPEDAEENTDEEVSDEGESAAGCGAASDIVTERINLQAGWANELSTDNLGFAGTGEVCYTISAYEGNTTQMIGLSEQPDTDAAFEHIEFAFYHRIASTLNSHRVYVWENNQRKGIFLNSSSSYEGSTFCIKRNEDSEIEYYINSELVYTSETRTDEKLYFDNSFYGFSEGSSSIWDHQPSHIEVSDISICSSELQDLVSNQAETSDLQQHGIGIFNQNIPNPFIDSSVINYDLSGEVYRQAELIITNNLGQVLSAKKLLDKSGTIKVSKENLGRGVFHYTVFLDGIAMDAKKMVVE